MKQSAIKQIYWGEAGSFEQIRLSEEYNEIEKKMFVAIESLLQKLNDEQKELFDKAYEYLGDRTAVFGADHFEEGFNLGLHIGIESKKRIECQ